MPGMVLASASPRRRELLGMLGLREIEILPAQGEPAIEAGETPEKATLRVARWKAEEVAALREHALVLAADTVVALDGAILGKPRDAAEAAAMLRALSGRTHEVYTGVALAKEGRRLAEAACTRVTFRPLREAEISAYVATGEPLDKAGAYGAQGRGSLFVERIEGDFFNVVGLPLCLLGQMLRSFGVDLMEQRA